MKKDWMIKESELDDNQMRVITATLDKSCVVRGCAGSGKSILALQKARRIKDEHKGSSCIVIVYTKALCEYMKLGIKALDLDSNVTYHEVWDREPSDYIIVDEIQDFTQEEIKEFISATKKNFYFFGDTAQSIYTAFRGGIPHVEDISRMAMPVAKDFELYNNYRLPKPIARVAQQMRGNDCDESVYRSDEVEMPRFIKVGDPKSQCEAIHRIIERRELRDVAILLPDNNRVKEVYGILRTLGSNYEVKYNEKEKGGMRNSYTNLDFQSSNPKVMTYHSAKGLQFEAVFIPCADGNQVDLNALYVALTRTYRYLYVLYQASLAGTYLGKVDTSLYKTTETDTVEEI